MAFRLGSPLRLTITACGCGITDPLILTVNDASIAVPTTNEWRRYTFHLPHRPTIYAHDLYLKWQSDGRLGPLVHRVEVSASSPDGALAGVRWPVLAVAAMVVLLRHAPVGAVVLRVAVVAGSAVAAVLLYEPQLMPRGVLMALGSLAAVVLTVLTGVCRERDRWGWRWLVLWGVLLWALAAPQVLGTWFMDDAFISFRYARNLVQGIGLTFNPGEVVEGYTNFLWTMIIAGGMAAGFEPVVTAQVLCTTLSLATLLVSYRLAEAWWPGRPWCVLPPLVLALSPPFLLYTARGSGMETALVTFLALVALWLVWHAHNLRAGVLAGVVCALVMMTRPDEVLVVAAGVGVAVLAGLRGHGHARSAHLRAAVGVIIGVVLLYGPYFLWRYSYYGYLLPNTFYAKVGATLPQIVRGIRYTGDFFWQVGLFPLLLMLALSVAGVLRRMYEQQYYPQAAHQAGPAAFLWAYLLLTTGYVIAVGGDQFPLGRFFIPVLPPLALLLTHGVAVSWDVGKALRGQRWGGAVLPAAASVVVALLLVANALQFPASDSRMAGQPVWVEKKVAMKGAEQGYWLLRNTPPDAVVATGIAGALPYYSNRYTIDMLGLNDTHIAHVQVETMGQGIAGTEKTDVDYVLNREPDYIPLSTTGMLQDVQRFHREYELIEVPGPKGGILSFYRRDKAVR
jgi:hypothetical protein